VGCLGARVPGRFGASVSTPCSLFRASLGSVFPWPVAQAVGFTEAGFHTNRLGGFTGLCVCTYVQTRPGSHRRGPSWYFVGVTAGLIPGAVAFRPLLCAFVYTHRPDYITTLWVSQGRRITAALTGTCGRASFRGTRRYGRTARSRYAHAPVSRCALLGVAPRCMAGVSTDSGCLVRGSPPARRALAAFASVQLLERDE